MAMDVTFENEQSFTSGSTDAGVKMTDTTKPAPSAPPQPDSTYPEGAKRAFQGKMFPQPPAQQQQSGDTGQRSDSAAPTPSWPETPEQAQSLIDRLMASPKFKADYANSNNPDRAKLVEGMSELFKLANPEPEERQAQTVQDLVDNLPDMEKFAGIHQPDIGPNAGPVLDQGDYAQFVSYVIDTHIPSETAQSLVNDYATRFAASGWKGLTAEDFSDLRTKYTGRLSPQVMDTLEKWVTTEVYPRMRAQRQAGGRS